MGCFIAQEMQNEELDIIPYLTDGLARVGMGWFVSTKPRRRQLRYLILVPVLCVAIVACGRGLAPVTEPEEPVAEPAQPTEPEPPVEQPIAEGPPTEPEEPVAEPAQPAEPEPPVEQPVAEGPLGGPMLPPGSSWKYVWGDEFDGDGLNRERWGFTPRSWGLAKLQENVTLADGRLVLTNTRHEDPSGDVYYNTTAIWSRPEPGSSRDTRAGVGFETVYGYFEASIQLPPTVAGVHAAFWLQSYYKNPDGSHAGSEVDILEAPSVHDQYQVAIHKRVPGTSRISWERDIPVVGVHDGFHVFAVHWQPDRYDFYANGELVATHDNSVVISHVPTFVYLTTGFHWEWDEVDRPGMFPNEARVDWVRVWKVDDGGNE